MKSILFFILAILLMLAAIGCDIAVIVFQCIEQIARYGALFSRVIVGHWSLWLLFGNVLFIPAFICFVKSSD